MTTVTKLHDRARPMTTFQFQGLLQREIDQVAQLAFVRGQASGQRLAERHANRALGIGVCFGFGLGVTFVLLATSFLPAALP